MIRREGFENPLGVPAHRHQNPDGSLGGWVADTAWVAPTATVGPDALVCGTAWVAGSARVLDHAQVAGGSLVFGDALVASNADYLHLIADGASYTAFRTTTGWVIPEDAPDWFKQEAERRAAAVPESCPAFGGTGEARV